MNILLTLHPDSRCMAATRIDVEAARPRPGALELRYVVTGNMADLRMPPVTAPERADGLWRHACFEAFIRPSPADAYYEFNFAPSTQWAAYRFDGYRGGMAPVAGLAAPHIEIMEDRDQFELRVTLDLDPLPDLPRGDLWRLGLSAVIEESGGDISYWALAHPPGKADFHHSDCFALELAPA